MFLAGNARSEVGWDNLHHKKFWFALSLIPRGLNV
jgi:hypothetical protein